MKTASHKFRKQPGDLDRWVYRLEELVKRITPKNVQDEIDTSGPVGREVR